MYKIRDYDILGVRSSLGPKIFFLLIIIFGYSHHGIVQFRPQYLNDSIDCEIIVAYFRAQEENSKCSLLLLI